LIQQARNFVKVTSIKVFVRVMVFGLLLGAASTAYADNVAIATISFSNLQFTPATGTAQLTINGVNVRADATNTFGEHQNNISNTVPLAQTTAIVTFASATMSASTANTASGSASVNVTGTAASFGIGGFTGTLVLAGGEGNVNVTISGLLQAMGQVATDEFGQFAQAEELFNITVNGVSVFSSEMLISVNGPNQTGQFQLLASQLSRVISLPFGTHTIGVTLSPASFAISEVPEPASVLLLVSGMGFMMGVLKKRRTRADD
jgi:hypothetical protein